MNVVWDEIDFLYVDKRQDLQESNYGLGGVFFNFWFVYFFIFILIFYYPFFSSYLF